MSGVCNLALPCPGWGSCWPHPSHGWESGLFFLWLAFGLSFCGGGWRILLGVGGPPFSEWGCTTPSWSEHVSSWMEASPTPVLQSNGKLQETIRKSTRPLVDHKHCSIQRTSFALALVSLSSAGMSCLVARNFVFLRCSTSTYSIHWPCTALAWATWPAGSVPSQGRGSPRHGDHWWWLAQSLRHRDPQRPQRVTEPGVPALLAQGHYNPTQFFEKKFNNATKGCRRYTVW